MNGTGGGAGDSVSGSLVRPDCEGRSLSDCADGFALQFGTTGRDWLRAVALHPAGDLIVVGETRGPLAASHAGEGDAFVLRVSANSGELVWSWQFGRAGNDGARAVAVDAAGDVLVVGYIDGWPDLDGAPVGDAFVAKLDGEDGDTRWLVPFGGEADDRAAAVALDDAGRVLLAGEVRTGERSRRTAFVRVVSGDDGTLQWERALLPEAGHDADVSVAGVAFSAVADGGAGAAWVAGSVDGGPVEDARGQGQALGGVDGFLIKLDMTSGERRWARALGGEAEDQIEALVLDDAGEPMVAGHSRSALTDDVAPTSLDVFAMKLAPGDGAVRWTRRVASERDSYLFSAAAVAGGGLLLGGRATAEFLASGEAFVVELAGDDGSPVWDWQFGSDADDWLRGLAPGPAGSVYVAGNTYGTLAAPGHFGDRDAFVARILPAR